jgi:hypothetical protein
MKKEEIMYLQQLFVILEKRIDFLEEAYKEKNAQKLNKIKKEIIENQQKIAETIK